MTGDVVLRVVERGAGPICRTILESVPEWFGIPEANDDYVARADRTPTTVASVDGQDVGLMNLVHHSPYAAEVHLMAVVREHHRRGIGRRLLEHAEHQLASAGVEFLQVKTLSPSREDPNYERTRAFYLAHGFRVLEEFPTLWDPSNPALQLIKTVSRPETSMELAPRQGRLAALDRLGDGEARLDFTAHHELMRPDFADYRFGADEPVVGVAAYVETLTEFRGAIADFAVDVPVPPIVDAHHVTTTWVYRGTFASDVWGLPATGRSLRWRGCSVWTFDDDGRIRELRSFADVGQLLAQIGGS